MVVADFDGEGLSGAAEGDTFGYVQYPLPLSDGESSAFVDEETRSAAAIASARATTAASATAAPRPRSDAPYEQDHDESLLPLSPEGGDPRGSVMWVIAGSVRARARRVRMVQAATSGGRQEQAAEAEAHAVEPKALSEPEAPSPAAGEAGAAAAEAQEVEVNIHTDFEQATLFVNGEAQGELSSEQSRNLKLHPGPYTFEAHSPSNTITKTEVMVRGDMPMDVFLELPKGASDGPRAEAPKAPEEAAPRRSRRRVCASRSARPRPSRVARNAGVWSAGGRR